MVEDKMKALLIKYNEKEDTITLIKESQAESWVEICRKYNDDVHRIRDIKDIEGYTGLYECFDDNDKSCYYIVEEDRELFRLKQRHFLRKVGLEKE